MGWTFRNKRRDKKLCLGVNMFQFREFVVFYEWAKHRFAEHVVKYEVFRLRFSNILLEPCFFFFLHCFSEFSLISSKNTIFSCVFSLDNTKIQSATWKHVKIQVRVWALLWCRTLCFYHHVDQHVSKTQCFCGRSGLIRRRCGPVDCRFGCRFIRNERKYKKMFVELRVLHEGVARTLFFPIYSCG